VANLLEHAELSKTVAAAVDAPGHFEFPERRGYVESVR
jgi:hypothetical protein